MKRSTVSQIVCACAILGLAACHKGEAPTDPFVEASLRQATYGEVTSETLRYKIINPRVVAVLGDLMVIEQGKISEFVIGNGIAAKYDSLTDKSSVTFRVVKSFSPIVHFECVAMVSPKDSIPIPQDKPVAFPRTADALDFTPPDDYERVEMPTFRFNDTQGLREMDKKKFALRARLVREQEDSAMVWFLEGDGPSAWGKIPKLRIKQPRPSLEVVLELLLRTEQDFMGGVTLTEIEPWDARRVNYVCGTVEIGYVRFLDRVFLR